MSKIVVKEQASAPATPDSGYFSVYAKTDGKIYGKNDAGTEYDLTGSQAGMTSFTLAGDAGTPQTIEQANTVTIAGGEGLASTAGATDTVTVNLDINSLTADATPDGATDYVLTWDASASAHKKVLIDNLPSGGGGMTSFSVAADTGTPETVSDGNTLTIAGGLGLSSTVAATDTVTVDMDINGLTAEATVDGAADYLALYDASAGTIRKVLPNSLPSTNTFNLAGDAGTPQAIVSGNTLTVAGGVGLLSTAGATDTVTVDLDINSLTADATPVKSTDYVATWDASASTHKKVLLSAIAGAFTASADGGTPQSIDDGDTFTIAGGSAISTTASATNTVTVDLNITELTEDLTPDGATDYVVTYDASGAANKKVLINNLPSSGGGMTSFTLAGDAGTPQTISDANTLTVAGGSGISTSAGATDTLTVNLDINELTADTTPDLDADYLVTYDASAGANKKILLSKAQTSPYGVSNINEASNYTTTSTTFVDIDATDLSRTITTSGGDVLVYFNCSLSTAASNQATLFDIDVDGARTAGDDGIIGTNIEGSQVHSSNVTFMRLITGLSAASHTFKVQWRVTASTTTLYAGAGTANADVHPQFWVKEIFNV